ncbi:HD domain-containing phosphohydrolase [Brevibacillus ginsengisoli]|uniref:HD domain-containing phosphohydrolase n=1 Tax=Brevibacillus ginsengisoli TaxID=363854 RepID=UPI003CE675BF
MLPNRSFFKSYTNFIILLPILFSLIVYVGYSQAKTQYQQAGLRNLDRQLNVITKVANQYDLQVKNQQITLAQAQTILKNTLSGPMLPNGTRDISKLDITLGPGDYLFILNSKGDVILHPQLEGKNAYNLQTPDGRYLIREMIEHPENTLYYTWKNSNEENPREKIAVIRYFPNWDWYIAISTYNENFFGMYNNIKYLLIFLVAGSYIITAFLFYNAWRKEKALLQSTNVSKQLAYANQNILKTLAVALEERDAYTSGHSQRVAYYMKLIATHMALSKEFIDTIYTGGLLHDIGKIGIEDNILLKPGRLTQEEFEIIKTHPVRGEALLRKLYAQVSDQDDAQIKTILEITRHHHERFDGRGYPDQLKEHQIPLVARIAAVADSFDAMTSNRSYRKGLSFSKACSEIHMNSGSQFCPTVVEAFFHCINEQNFFHAHQITWANEILLQRFQETEVAVAAQQ